jgi:hypothetical protein
MNINISKICSAIKLINSLPNSDVKDEALLSLNLLLAETIMYYDWYNSMKNLPELDQEFTL